MRRQRVLALTGATGAIGSRFLTGAVSRGHQVKALARVAPRPSFSGVHWAQFNLSQGGKLNADVLRGAEVVVHLAAHIPRNHDDPDEALLCWQTNVLGTHRLIQAMAEAKIGRLIQVSSANIYAPWLANPDEKSPIHPQTRTFYLSSKAAQEWCAESMCQQYGIDLLTLRLSSVFATGSSTVDHIARKMLNGEIVELANEGNFGADFISSDDVLSAMFLMLDGNCTGTVNVASGTRTTLSEITQMLSQAAGRKDEAIRLLPTEDWQDLGFPAINIAKLKAFGFRPSNLYDDLSSLVERLVREQTDKEAI